MDTSVILTCLIVYFLLLYVISLVTSRGADNTTFFMANRNSAWYLIAFGMIGASLSGVTFISVPGLVQAEQFSYMQMVLGYIPGYFIIAFVLMPMYYKRNLTTIYTYLGQRLGPVSYKTGAYFFLLSRLMGSSLRMYLTAYVLHTVLFEKLGMEFWHTAVLSIALVWFYTFKGGIKTIIWTDTLQTAFMLIAVVATVVTIGQEMGWGVSEVLHQIKISDYSQVFFFDDINDSRHFFKQFLSGASIALVMTGLDQEMMQRNLTCRNLKEAQTNMITFSFILVGANLLFMGLGAVLYLYAGSTGMTMPASADELYGLIATNGTLPTIVGVCFVLGLVAAAYSGADSALAALTTSFCIDILNIEKKEATQQEKIRKWVHIGFSLLTVVIIIVARSYHDKSLIAIIFKVASYTYGPLLGMFFFGLFTKRMVHDWAVPFIAIAAPILSYFVAGYSKEAGYTFGYEILLVNGAITWFGLWFSGFFVPQTLLHEKAA